MLNINIFLFLLVICTQILLARSAENDTDTMRLFLFHSNTISYAKENSINDSIFIRTHHGVRALDYHARKKILYWTEEVYDYSNSRLLALTWDTKTSCDDKYQKIGLNCFTLSKKIYYSNSEIRILRDEDWNPRSLAVDYIGDKLYVVNTVERSVNVLDLFGKNKGTVFEYEPLIPFEVAIDPPKGLMFVLAANTELEVLQLYRVNMDGTEPQLIVNNTDLLESFEQYVRVGFALDTSKQRIYFGNFNERKIEKVNYSGNERITVTRINRPCSLSVHKDTLYYIKTKKNYKNTFYTCKLNETGICDKSSHTKIPLYKKIKPYALKSIVPNLQSSIANPCRVNNGGCQHHCLLRSSNTSSQDLNFGCICNNGYSLESDLKSCTPTKVIYAYDQMYIPKGTTFSTLRNSSQNFFPLSKNLLIKLTYNKADTIFYGSAFRFFKVSQCGNAIYDANSNEYGDEDLEESEIVSLTESERYTKIARAMTYDWITKNLYFVKLYDGKLMGDLMVIRYNNDRTDEYNYEDYNQYGAEVSITLTKIYPPTFMVIHPYRGYLFISLRNGLILRLNSDGTDMQSLPYINDSVTLAIDFNDDKLYWSDTLNTIWYSDLDGNNAEQLLKINWNDENPEKISMYIYGEHIYLKSKIHKKFWWYNKTNGEMIGSLRSDIYHFSNETVGMKVSAKDAHYVNIYDHPCIIKNGGCGMFCFGVPEENSGNLTQVCACNKNENFQSYGVKCRDQHEDVRLLFYNSKNLFYANANSSTKLMKFGSRNGINVTSIDYHATKNTLYWISPREGYWTRKSQLFAMTLSQNFSNQNIKILREEENWIPRSLAVDYIGDKLYIVDASERSVVVFNLDGSNKASVFKDDSLQPFDVLLDPPEGLMFILAANPRRGKLQIYRASMDGDESQLIIDKIVTLESFRSFNKTGFAIDTIKKRLYYGNKDSSTIESIDYNGLKRLIVVIAENAYNINIYKDTLFWLEEGFQKSVMCEEKKSKLKTCRLNDLGVCYKNSIRNFNVGQHSPNFETFTVKPISLYQQSQISNPCGNDNGPCQHHCLLRSKNSENLSLGKSCICKQGYHFDRSYHNLFYCVEDQEMYSHNVAYVPVVTKSFPQQAFSRNLLARLFYNNNDTIYYKKPFRFFQVNELGDALLDIDLGPKDIKRIYSSYRNHLLCDKAYIEINKVNSTLIQYENERIARPITYDWITENLYYVKLTNDVEMGELMVLKYGDPSNLQNFENFENFEVNEIYILSLAKIYIPKFMVVHPGRGYLFVALNNGSTIKMNSDGSDIMILPNVENADVLAIDFIEDKLYWLSNDEACVLRSNLDGSDVEKLFDLDRMEFLNLFEYMYIEDQYIYLKSYTLNRIEQYDKLTKEYRGYFKIDNNYFYQENIAIKVPTNKSRQESNEISHPCTFKNGGCVRFCFGVPNKNQSLLERVCA